mgnify:CR=1 FL=1
MAYALVLETETVLVMGTSAATAEILERVAEDGPEELLLADPGSGLFPPPLPLSFPPSLSRFPHFL